MVRRDTAYKNLQIPVYYTLIYLILQQRDGDTSELQLYIKVRLDYNRETIIKEMELTYESV